MARSHARQTGRLAAPPEPKEPDEPIEPMVVPEVDYPGEPAVKIYDASNDGTYWFRGIGFDNKFTRGQ